VFELDSYGLKERPQSSLSEPKSVLRGGRWSISVCRALFLVLRASFNPAT
jgi:hypothetical protein